MSLAVCEAVKKSWAGVRWVGVMVTLVSTTACEGTESLPGGSDAGNGTGGAADQECASEGDPTFPQIPLDCACEAGSCPPAIPEDGKLGAQHSGEHGSASFLSRYGTCASGHRVLAETVSCEAERITVWDEQGSFVYLKAGWAQAPSVCDTAEEAPSSSRGFSIGESDPSSDCDYCLFDWSGRDDGDEPGSCYGPLADLPACPDELYE